MQLQDGNFCVCVIANFTIQAMMKIMGLYFFLLYATCSRGGGGGYFTATQLTHYLVYVIVIARMHHLYSYKKLNYC